jgi:hypothetical protein
MLDLRQKLLCTLSGLLFRVIHFIDKGSISFARFTCVLYFYFALILRDSGNRSIAKSHIRDITLLENPNLFLRLSHFVSARLTHVIITVVAPNEINILAI